MYKPNLSYFILPLTICAAAVLLLQSYFFLLFFQHLVNMGVGNTSGCYGQGTRSAVEKPQNE